MAGDARDSTSSPCVRLCALNVAWKRVKAPEAWMLHVPLGGSAPSAPEALPRVDGRLLLHAGAQALPHADGQAVRYTDAQVVRPVDAPRQGSSFRYTQGSWIGSVTARLAVRHVLPGVLLTGAVHAARAGCQSGLAPVYRWQPQLGRLHAAVSGMFAALGSLQRRAAQERCRPAHPCEPGQGVPAVWSLRAEPDEPAAQLPDA